MIATDVLTPEIMGRLDADAATARGLPGRAYGAEFYELEQHQVFPKVWCTLALASDVPNPGDVAPVELAGWPLLVVRDAAAEIRVFHNMCRHRAMRLVNEPCNVGDVLSCPWHAWRYGLDGSLLASPRLGGEREHRVEGFDPAALGLVPVRTARWLDFVFVNIDGQGPEFDTHIAPLKALFEDFDLSGLERADSWQLDYPGNWKVAVEGAIEDYHLPIGHPQVVQGATRWNARLDYADSVFYCNSTAREFTDQSSANIATGLSSGLPAIPYSGGESHRRTFFMNVFPTGMLQVHGDNAVQGLFLPLGAERTRLVFNHFFVGEGASAAEFCTERQAIKEEWQLVFKQDIPFVEQVHENYKLRDHIGIDTRFSPFWESNIQRFQQCVARLMLADAGSPA